MTHNVSKNTGSLHYHFLKIIHLVARERKSDREKSHQLVHPQDVCNDQGWTRPPPQVRDSIQVHNVSARSPVIQATAAASRTSRRTLLDPGAGARNET